jgi:hypothetical protein
MARRCHAVGCVAGESFPWSGRLTPLDGPVDESVLAETVEPLRPSQILSAITRRVIEQVESKYVGQQQRRLLRCRAAVAC